MKGNKKFKKETQMTLRQLVWKSVRTIPSIGGLLALLILLAWTNSVQAQTVACNGTPSAPITFGTDASCEVELTADMVLEDPGSAVGPYFLEVETLSGNLLVQGLEPVLIPSGNLEQVLAVTVTDTDSGNNCTGYILLQDNLAPAVISCEDVEVDCFADTSPAAIGFPVFEDNCDTNPTLNHTDSVTDPDCNTPGPAIGFITRTWTATDDFGNSSQCTQTITLLELDFTLIQFPGFIDLECDPADVSPNVTGFPTYNGQDLTSNTACFITVDFSDQIVPGCNNSSHSYQIVRTWTIIDDCTNQIYTEEQIIDAEDNIDPTISCPSAQALTFGSNSNTCNGNIIIPSPTVSDNCTALNDLEVTYLTSFGGSGQPGDVELDVPVGQHSITYTVVDECNGWASCTATINVIDDSPPTAICDEFSVVSIPSSGVAIVPAFNLDDGSYDNCGPIGFQGSTDGGNNFAPSLIFDCNDVGQSVAVIIKVYELQNIESFNECEVVVNVMDNLSPSISCPGNITIDCQENYDDLTPFGLPVIFDNCGYTVTSDSIINLDVCGVGTITRTFTAEDDANNSASCSQIITVENLTPLDGSVIDWPDDFEVNDLCLGPAALHPDSLPSPFDYPVIPSQICALPAINFSDQFFDIESPACYKIVRTWTVMDWCSFDPDNPSAGGIWTETQVLKVNDTTLPELTVPNDTIVGVDSDCAVGEVTLAPATVTDCSPGVTVTHNSPYAFASGADASGTYPFGTTDVVFTAVDGCGNTKRDTTTVTVLDNTPPSLQCMELIAELGPDGQGGAFVDVAAALLVTQTNDNCTAPSNIERFIRVGDGSNTAPPNTQELTFDCMDVGVFEVEVWVVDESGNGDLCVVELEIQDNMNLCPFIQTATIAGMLATEEGEEMEGVEVNLTSNSSQPNSTGTGGYYTFEDLLIGYDYTVSPEHDTEWDNGLSTYDLVMITRHILGTELLDSPYKIIAADANRTNAISTMDIVELRKIILSIEESIDGNTSWRFIPLDYEFPDPANPFAEHFPEVANYNNLSGDEMDADFVAVKVGDVNGSAIANSSMTASQDRSTTGELTLMVEDQQLEAGQVYEIAVQVPDFESITGFQFTLRFDPAVLQMEGIGGCDLPGLSEQNFGFHKLQEGILTASWHQAKALSLQPDQCIFTLNIRALQAGWLSEQLQLVSIPTMKEAYTASGSILDMEIIFMEKTNVNNNGNGVVQLFQNQPNPFREQTEIRFFLPQQERVLLRVMDISGRIVFERADIFTGGLHNLTIDRSSLLNPGMYYYQIRTKHETLTRKMLLLN